jgi:translation initiation factor IF-3
LNAIINEGIVADEVRLVLENGDQAGIVKTSEARKRAAELNLDLVLISDASTPPVAKILDYKKHLYEQQMKKRNSRRKQHNSDVKEVRFKLKIDQNDFNIKVNQAIKFLKGGDKLKLQVQFRGREIQYPQLGVDLLEKVNEKVSEFGTIITPPLAEGRNVSMTLQPTAKKEKTISEQRRRGADVKSARAERQAKRLAAKGLDVNGKKIDKKGSNNAEK